MPDPRRGWVSNRLSGPPMSGPANSTERHTAKAWILPISLWVAGPIVGVVVAHFSSFGDHAHDAFFEVCALIEPLFGLALFVELAVVLGQLVSVQAATPANRDLGRSVLRANAGLICVSDGLALYAVAAGRASTFLVVAIAIPMLIQILLLVDCGYQRTGLGMIRGG